MDATLPDRLAEDLETAFESLVRGHQHLVYGIALRTLRHPQDAQDVAQEVFVRAYRALCSYPRERIRELQPRPWLARITLNLCRNRLRSSPRRAESIDGAEAVRDLTAGPAEAWERRESATRWQGLLATLPDHHRRAVELRHVEGLSYPELALALDRPLGTVKAQVHRGLRQLRAAWEAQEEEANR
ncbi:MAG: sigma-70 family RNA polymerase sigma factor [Chloroflexi bacterium]|nr:sigma-70 family RNA polymerase sigma factor [Chloroflexota bacterium]